MRPRRLAAPSAVVALALAIGCGGRGGSPKADARGVATMTLKWPARDRTIPDAANSLVVTLKQGTTLVATQTLARPTGGTSTATFSNLPFATLDVSVKAYPTTNGTGVAQAEGASSLVVTQDPAANVATVNLGSTVTKLVLSPGVASVAVDGTLRLTASARNAADEVVLLSSPAGGQETVAWSGVSGGVSVTPVGTGLQCDVACAAEGAAKVRATFGSVSADLPVTVTSAGLARGGWPIAGGTYGNTGQGKGRGAAGTLGWKTSLGTSTSDVPVDFHIVGPDGIVYAQSSPSPFAQSSTVLAALDPNGAILWQKAATYSCNGLALTDAGLLLVVSGTTIQGLNSKTGSLVWSYSAPNGPLLSGLAVGRDSTVYVHSSDALYALNPTTGGPLWSRALALTGGLAVGDDGALYAHGGTNVVYALDPANGATRWSKTITGDKVTDDVTVANGRVYLESWVWTRSPSRGIDGDFEGRLTSATIGTTGTTGGTTQLYYDHITVSALDAATGNRVWAYEPPVGTGYATSPPNVGYSGEVAVSSDGQVIAPSRENVASIDAATGAARWLASAHMYYEPAIASDGTILMVTGGGALRAFGPTDGSTLWTTSVSAIRAARPAIAGDGKVYVGTIDGDVVQVR